VEMQQDQGTIYVFNTVDGTVRRLRGHTGTIWSLKFVQGADAPYPVSAAKPWDARSKRYVVDLRLWEAGSGKELGTVGGAKMRIVGGGRPVGLGGWARGDKIHVRLAAGDGRLRLWNAKTKEISEANDENNNFAVLYLPDRKRLLTSTPIGTKEGWRARLRTW